MARHRAEVKAQAITARIAKLQEELKGLKVAVGLTGVLPELHDAATGCIDAQRVADFMGVALKPLAEGLGLNYKAVHRNASARGFQKSLRPVKRALEILQEFFGPPEAMRVWLNTPHADLDGATALETILAGKADAVVLILENAWNGVPV